MARRGVAYVPQGGGTLSALSVLDNLRLGAWIQRGPLDNAYARVFELLPFLYDAATRRGGIVVRRRPAPAGSGLRGDGEAAARALRRAVRGSPAGGRPAGARGAPGVCTSAGRRSSWPSSAPGWPLASTGRAVVLDTGRVVFDGSAEALRSDGSAFPALLAP